MVEENLAGGRRLGTHLRGARGAGGDAPQIRVGTVAAGVDGEEIRDVDPQHTVLSVVSTCLFFFMARPTVQIMHPDAEDDWGAFVEARKEHLFDLIYHGLAPRPEGGSGSRAAPRE